MSKRSAGLLMYRRRDSALEVFLVHPGGPLWAKRDLGAWTIPKGQYSDDEEPLDAAKREFEEETGFTPKGEYVALGDLRQAGGKVVMAWAFEGDCDPEKLKSNTFTMEWPPRSGRQLVVPEIDRGGWFPLAEAHVRLLPGQVPFLDRLLGRID